MRRRRSPGPRIVKSERAAIRLLSSLMPHSQDMGQLVADVAAFRRRPIHLGMRDLGRTGLEPSGVTLGTDTADYIFVNSDESGWHRTLVILHELGHVVLGHVDALMQRSDAGDPVAMWRHMYKTTEEQQAERIARLLLLQAMSRAGVDDSDVARIASIVE